MVMKAGGNNRALKIVPAILRAFLLLARGNVRDLA